MCKSTDLFTVNNNSLLLRTDKLTTTILFNFDYYSYYYHSSNEKGYIYNNFPSIYAFFIFFFLISKAEYVRQFIQEWTK